MFCFSQHRRRSELMWKICIFLTQIRERKQRSWSGRMWRKSTVKCFIAYFIFDRKSFYLNNVMCIFLTIPVSQCGRRQTSVNVVLCLWIIKNVVEHLENEISFPNNSCWYWIYKKKESWKGTGGFEYWFFLTLFLLRLMFL